MASLMRSSPRRDVRVPIMRASHYSFARSLSNVVVVVLLLLLLAIAAQVQARPLLAERLRMTIEEYARSLRPLPLRHAASPPVITPCEQMPATAATVTIKNDSYDQVMGATSSPPPPPSKACPPTQQIKCLCSPPSNDDLIISMVTDLDFEAPSKSPPLLRPPEKAPPERPGTVKKPPSPPPPSPKRPPPVRPSPSKTPPSKPRTSDFEAPSRSPPPAPKPSRPFKPINNSEMTYKSPPPSQKLSLSTHQLNEEFGQLIIINSERSPPSGESYYSSY